MYFMQCTCSIHCQPEMFYADSCLHAYSMFFLVLIGMLYRAPDILNDMQSRTCTTI